MKNMEVVEVCKSRFGKCKLTFYGPDTSVYDGDTNHYIYNDKDPNHLIRVWYYPSSKSWACEWHDSLNRNYTPYGTSLLIGPHFRSAEQAWKFISEKYWA